MSGIKTREGSQHVSAEAYRVQINIEELRQELIIEADSYEEAVLWAEKTMSKGLACLIKRGHFTTARPATVDEHQAAIDNGTIERA